MKQELQLIIRNSIKKLFDLEIDDINLGIPPKNISSDFCFNVGVLVKFLRKNPDILALELKNFLDKEDNRLIESLEIIGSYLNIKISNNFYKNIFDKLYIIKNNLIKDIGKNKNIVIDYIGANVGKPLHIGHMCTPNQGQVMINIYKKLGYNVISDSHIGDWGIIFGKLILAFKLWGNEEKLKKNKIDYLLELYIKITNQAEKNAKINDDIRSEFKLLSKGDITSVKLWKIIRKYSISFMQTQLDRLGINPKYNIGESFYEGLNLPKFEKYPDLKYNMKSIVGELISKSIGIKNKDNSVGVIFHDKLKIPSCILQKRDETHGYLASDLSAIKYRIENWNPEKIIYFVDSRQTLHLKQTFIIAKRAGWVKNTELFHAYNGFISLKDGIISSRKGRIIKLDKLLDEAENRAEKIILEKRNDINGKQLENLKKIIGIGAIKYGYLKKSREIDTIFDWDEFMSFEGNSGPYIQYAYVRAIRILENYKGEILYNSKGTFENKEEIQLIKLLIKYNDTLIKTSISNMPHILCKYCYDLTKSFNYFYNNINILNPKCQDSKKCENKKIIRLRLVELFSIILKDSFDLLGIKMPNKM